MTRQSALAEEWPVNGAMPPAEGHIIQGHLLSPGDLDLARKKRSNANRLGFAVLLLFFRGHGRFPRAPSEIDPKRCATRIL